MEQQLENTGKKKKKENQTKTTDDLEKTASENEGILWYVNYISKKLLLKIF